MIVYIKANPMQFYTLNTIFTILIELLSQHPLLCVTSQNTTTRNTKQSWVNGPPSILANTSHRVGMHSCAHCRSRRPEVWLFHTSPRSPPFSDHRKHPGAGQQTPSRCCQALQNLWIPYDSQAWEHNNHSHILSRHSQRSTAKKWPSPLQPNYPGLYPSI